LLLGPDERLQKDITVITFDKTVEKHLSRFKNVIGEDYEGYKGHIYRVLTYTLHFLSGNEENRDLIALALVYHDIALWTDSTLAYIEPSVAQFEKRMKSFNLSSKQENLVRNLIYWHHKTTPYHGTDEEIVNALIKSDLLDASYGFITNGMPRGNINKVMSAIPEAGFHMTLAKFGPKLHGWNFVRIVKDLSSILK
jgi:hypothetical protein